MLLKEQVTPVDTRRYSLADQVKAFALILREEFGVPFAFFEPATGEPVPGQDAGRGDWSPDLSAALAQGELCPTVVAALTADGRPVVKPLAEGGFLVALLLYEANKPVLVAGGAVPSLARTDSEQPRERERLQKWVQAVADRLRLTDQLLSRRRVEEEQNAQITLAWEAILTLDRLIRRLRIHKNPDKNQKRILESAFGLLDVQAMIWVPRAPEDPVVTVGEPGLGAFDCRQLADALSKSPDRRAGEPLLCNRVQETTWGPRFLKIESLLAFEAEDQGHVGWFIAINKQTRRQGDKETRRQGDKEKVGEGVNEAVVLSTFRKADAVLLAAFAGLLELHARGAGRYQDLKELLVGLTRSLTSALDAKDSYTYGHSERVARIAVELGRELGLSSDELSDIYLAGLLHDVGKIGVRDAVLSKPGPLTPEEFEHIKQHVVIGYKILADLRPIRNLLPGVLYHHERIDGRGYPDGLAGDNIPLLARILAVADGYDAMSTARPYRDPMPCRKVEQILLDGAGTQWDKRIIEAFTCCRQKIHAIRQQGVGESLCHAIDGALRTGDSSMLIKPDALSKSAPTVNTN